MSGGVEAWVAWDPFFSAAQRQSAFRVVRDGQGLSLYKRYYLASDSYVAANGPVLRTLFDKLCETGAWGKAHPGEAAKRLAPLWKIEADVIEQANAHRSYRVEPVTRAALSEQQTIADAFRAESLLPRAIDTSALAIWTPPPR